MVLPCPSCGAVNRIPSTRLGDGPRCGRCRHPIDATHPLTVTDDGLDTLLRTADVPVLVDFWAPWCGPCRAVAPHLEALASRHAGRLVVAKVNTDEHGRTASRLEVRAIPTLALWKGGHLVVKQAGALVGPQLEAFVAPHL